MEFFQWMEQTGLATWIRESPSPFAYASILLMHTVGMALVVGIVAGIDLRILGFAPGLQLAPLERFFPVLWIGFWINALTGTLLVVADASTKLANLDFYVKMVLIALALVNQQMIKTRVFHSPLAEKAQFPANTKVLAVTSLFLWIGAITSGRLLAYLGPVSGLQ